MNLLREHLVTNTSPFFKKNVDQSLGTAHRSENYIRSEIYSLLICKQIAHGLYNCIIYIIINVYNYKHSINIAHGKRAGMISRVSRFLFTQKVLKSP